MLKTYRILELSTAHVSLATRDLLDGTFIHVWPVSGMTGEHGWLIYAHDERPDGCPDDLWKCIERAHTEGASYLWFDQDLDPIDGLATYDW